MTCRALHDVHQTRAAAGGWDHRRNVADRESTHARTANAGSPPGTRGGGVKLRSVLCEVRSVMHCTVFTGHGTMMTANE